MPEVEHVVSVESVPGIPASIQKLPTDVMQVSEQMILLTWLAFGIAAFCLHKLLWKPILRAVESREKSIGDALDGAAQARKEVAESEARGRQVVEQASEAARALADQAAREAAASVARADQEAKEVTQRRFADAEREIEAAQRQASEEVRREAASYLGETLERLLRGHMTDEQKRAYQADILNEVRL
ncbi:MAG: ATP synthase F0 subunit B [bacterium]